MGERIEGAIFEGLERSCADPAIDRIVAAPGAPGIERIEASFHGNMFAPHRHDTYGIGLTLRGTQTFSYRGARYFSEPGNIIVLHPDEIHDGGAGTDEGLRYHILYIEPSLLQHVRSEAPRQLPFLKQPVIEDGMLRAYLGSSFRQRHRDLEPIWVSELIGVMAESLARHAGFPAKPLGPTASRSAIRARDYLRENFDRVVRADELESVTGMDRYALARHFRANFGTSPYRYLIMRRLERARELIATRMSLAETAVTCGFADQSHLNRCFKQAVGVTPGKWLNMLDLKASRV
ncbi:MAG: AraC family transcriptional regulator [Pseudomonadota bacterium]